MASITRLGQSGAPMAVLGSAYSSYGEGPPAGPSVIGADSGTDIAVALRLGTILLAFISNLVGKGI